MGKTVKIGLIGLGGMGTKHFEVYRGLPEVEIKAITDVDLAKRRGDIRQVRLNGQSPADPKLDLSGIVVFADAAEMLDTIPDLDIIDICVPTSYHAPYIRVCLAAGKHVFCEKPLCLDYREVPALAADIRASGRFFNLGLSTRALPAYFHAKELIRTGLAGPIRSAVFQRFAPSVANSGHESWFIDEKRSGGALLDFHIHDADAVHFFFGRPRAVSAFGAFNILGRNSGVDQVCSVYHYDDGKLVTAAGGWAGEPRTPFEKSFRIVGERATLQFDGHDYRIYWNGGEVEMPFSAESMPSGHHVELKYFTDCVRDNVVPDRYQTLAQVVDTMAIMHAERMSALSREREEIQYDCSIES